MTTLLDLIQQARSDIADLSVGVATAKVIDNEDPEGLGRVLLTYPWLGVDSKSGWARIATPMAGAERGYYALPEVGDEVLVSFDKGNLNHPYVLGALWNVNDAPPETNTDGKNNRRVFKSRAGHLLIFDDDSEKAKVEIETAAGHKITMDDSSGSEKIEIVDKSGSNSIVIDSAQNAINITSADKLSLEAVQIEIKSSANCKVEAGGQMIVKGAQVMIN